MATLSIKAEERKLFGRKVKRLRVEGLVPANIYGAGFKSQSIQVPVKEFVNAFEKAGETGVCEIEVSKGKKYPVLIHNVQKDPVDESILHVDFLKVDLTKKVTANIPLEMVGESPAEKQGLGTVVQYIDEVEVEALPQDLVDSIEVDQSVLDKEDSMIMIKDLKYDKSKIAIQNDQEQIIAKVELQKEEVEEPTPVAETEGEAVEGEAPTEGGEKVADGGDGKSQEGGDASKE